MQPSQFINRFIHALLWGMLLTSATACNEQKTSNPTQTESPAKPQVPKASESASQPKNPIKENQSPFSWSKLSGWHTQGTISRTTPIRIVFNRDVINTDLVGKDASKIMHISPAIKGSPIFESKSEIIWTPKEQLQAGTEYKVSIKSTGLKDVPSNVAPFKFSFHVIPLEFEIKTFGLSSIPDIDNKMLLKGQLLVSDRVDLDAVKSVLKATSQNNTLPIEWKHDSSGKKHSFTISNIIRESFATDVSLVWNGEPINIDTQGSQNIPIPSINNFKIIDTHVKHDTGSNPYVLVRFSDELDASQDIKGLVQLARNKYKVRINGNTISIFPNKNLSGSFTVRLSAGIKSKNNKSLAKAFEEKVVFDNVKPQVKFVGKGSILPENATLEIPFEAVGVKAIEVTALEIYPENIKHFLQVNRLSGDQETRRSGRYLWRKTIPLTAPNPNQWNRYSFNVTELMKKHTGGLLRLTLSIKRSNSTYNCPGETKPSKPKSTSLKNLEDNGIEETSGWDGISDYAEGYNNYDWDNRNNACTDSYFIYNKDKTLVSQNFISSNIGLIAKRGSDGNLHIISTDIRTSEPLTGVEFEVSNFQGQLLGKSKSDGSGFSTIQLSGTPFLLTAKKFKQVAYLKLNNKTALTTSHFPVGGKKISKGIKGIIYGERGVWRPGDDIYLTFVLQNLLHKMSLNNKEVPTNHPVTMKLINPRGRVVSSQTSTNSIGGFYAFKFKTAEKAETGSWMVKAYLGGSVFSKSIMIETVRPNRLKLELSFDNNSASDLTEKETVLYSSDGAPKGTLFSQWLHGATASNLKADISVRFSSKKTRFDKFSDYVFDDPARRLKSEDTVLLEGRLDDEGYLKFRKSLKPKGYSAGMLSARFTSRVFEEGGAFSISRSSFNYHPYKNYVGIKLPKGDATRGMLLTDITHTVKIASLSDKGEAVSLDKVRVSLYKVKWKWWWDKSASSLAEYADGEHKGLLKQDIISTVNGNGEWKFDIKYPEWGRYLIRACDLQGNHCTGKTVYIDWPGWAGRAQEEGSGAASRLNLFSDKTAYSVGETATIQLPAANQGRALLTLETGSRILEQRWITFTPSKNKTDSTVKVDKRVQFELPITANMAPNVYVHITLLQPHKDKDNDRPIRLYGIIPLEVADPATYLKPKIQVEKEWKPESKQTIVVSEQTGKPMNYTLAVVDEGLLGLTAFKTPNLHRHFYSKEALGVKTWDLFDEVIGAYGGKLERMLALGGGDDAESDNDDSKKRRFPPVVKFFGPFTLEAGKTAKHDIQLPAYLGQVRVMLVAGDKGAYGKANESVFVRQPLMLQASLPRVLGPDEEVAVPVTLFALDDSIKDVTINIKTDDLVSVTGDAEVHVKFSKIGEKIAFIKLKTANKEGKTHLHFSAFGGANGEHKTEADIYLDIRRANQVTSRSISKVIDPDTSWSAQGDAFGLDGTNQSVLEISSVPALNLDKRLKYLIRYPHGCLEQTTSSAFPQLYLGNVMSLDKAKQQKVEHHIQKAIERLQRFQTGTGDFSYWPGGNHHNSWASIYAGHFLIEANKRGFLVPSDLLNNWVNYQVDNAQRFTAGSEKYSHTQAYRLYVLALAGKPQMGAMNRLRESSKMNKKARWLLASAYQTASQPAAVKSLIQGMLPEVETVNHNDKTFSSTLGDLGLQLQSLVALNKKQDANQLLEKIAEEMNSDKFQSTQGIAWALMGVSRYLDGDTSHFSAQLTQDKASRDISSDKPISSVQLSQPDANFSLKNTSGVKLFATLVNHGVPKAGNEQALQKGFELSVDYQIRDRENAKQWNSLIDQSALQGSDMRFTVRVKNTSKHNTDNIALTIPVAAGMEILSAAEQVVAKGLYDYRDLRDDRIHYYFSLKAGQEKTFTLLVNATYLGRYYLPAINVEAMYDGNMQARQKGQWINIVKNLKKAKPAVAAAVTQAIPKKKITITVDKAWLYDSANETSQSKMYLIKGDEATIVDQATDSNNSEWFLVFYKGKKNVLKWLKKGNFE